MMDDLKNDLDYLNKETKINDALNQIKQIIIVENDQKIFTAKFQSSMV